MNSQEAFIILGIEPTTDKRAIKRAYAAKVKEYHPEEQPQEWQRVREAYEVALRQSNFAAHNSFSMDDSFTTDHDFSGENREDWSPSTLGQETGELGESSNQDGQKVGELGESSNQDGQKVGELGESSDQEGQETGELTETFEQLEELVKREEREKRKQHREKVWRAGEQLREMCAQKVTDSQIWDDFFSSQETEVLIDEQFISHWARTIMNLPMDRELFELMERWIEYVQEEGAKELWYIKTKLQEAYCKRYPKEEIDPGSRRMMVLFGIIVSAVFIIGSFFVSQPEKPEADEWSKSWYDYYRSNDDFHKAVEGRGELTELLEGLEVSTAAMEEEGAAKEAGELTLSEEAREAHQMLIQYCMREKAEENEEALKQMIEKGVCLQEGVYLHKKGEIPEGERFILEVNSSEPKKDADEMLEMSAEELLLNMMEEYSFNLWAIGEGGVYILYIDPLKVGLDMECQVSYSCRGESRELPMYMKAKGNELEEEYHYSIAGYKAIVVDIPSREEKIPCEVFLYQF